MSEWRRPLDDDATYDFDARRAPELDEQAIAAPRLVPNRKKSCASSPPANAVPAAKTPPVDVDDWDGEMPAVSARSSAETVAEATSLVTSTCSLLQPLAMDDDDEEGGYAPPDAEEEEEIWEAAPATAPTPAKTSSSVGDLAKEEWAMVHAGGIEVEGEMFGIYTGEGEGDGEGGSTKVEGATSKANLNKMGSKMGSYTEEEMRKAVAEAVSAVEKRARKQQELAVTRAIEAAADQLRQELEAQAVELEAEYEARLAEERSMLVMEKSKPNACKEADANLRASEEEREGASSSIRVSDSDEGMPRRGGAASRLWAAAEAAAGGDCELGGVHATVLSEVESRQERCLTVFRGAINALGSMRLQQSVLNAIQELEEATQRISKLKDELTSPDMPFIERIRIPSSLLAKPASTIDAEEFELDGIEGEEEEEHEL